mgnify:CR=1 FL=1
MTCTWTSRKEAPSLLYKFINSYLSWSASLLGISLPRGPFLGKPVLSQQVWAPPDWLEPSLDTGSLTWVLAFHFSSLLSYLRLPASGRGLGAVCLCPLSRPFLSPPTQLLSFSFGFFLLISLQGSVFLFFFSKPMEFIPVSFISVDSLHLSF